MGRTSSKVKDRYNAKVYEDVRIRVPKGKKALIEAFAASRGESVNSLINGLLQREMGLTDAEWKKHPTDETDGDPA